MFGIVRQKDNGEITLEPLLLIQRETHLFFYQGLDYSRGDVECTNLDFTDFAQIIDRLQRWFRCYRTES